MGKSTFMQGKEMGYPITYESITQDIERTLAMQPDWIMRPDYQERALALVAGKLAEIEAIDWPILLIAPDGAMQITRPGETPAGAMASYPMHKRHIVIALRRGYLEEYANRAMQGGLSAR